MRAAVEWRHVESVWIDTGEAHAMRVSVSYRSGSMRHPRDRLHLGIQMQDSLGGQAGCIR